MGGLEVVMSEVVGWGVEGLEEEGLEAESLEADGFVGLNEDFLGEVFPGLIILFKQILPVAVGSVG